jgi:putative redox protein
MKSRVTLAEGMAFEAELDGHTFFVDADEQFGGKDKGPKPKGLTLTSLCGCTAMDVISILRKMKTEPEEFWVEAETDLTDEHPKVFEKITLAYHFKGGEVPRENAEKAVNLSIDKYCGVNAMLKKAVEIEPKIIIE